MESSTAPLAVGACFAQHHRDEARGIPQLVAEVAVARDAREIEADVAARRGERGEREAQRVRAVRRDAFRELLARVLFDGRRELRLHEAGGALRDQRLEPMPSTISSGSMTLPFDFDILSPDSSRIRPVMYTSRNGTSPMNLRPIIIIRATQKKMMSKPVTSTLVG